MKVLISESISIPPRIQKLREHNKNPLNNPRQNQQDVHNTQQDHNDSVTQDEALMSIDLAALEASPRKYTLRLHPIKLINLLKTLDNHYYNVGEALVSDRVYDTVRDVAKTRMPDNPYFQQVGHSVASQDRRRVKLPHYLPSLNKIYPNTSESSRWYNGHTTSSGYLVMDKLDGVSLLLVYTSKGLFAYTRGDGVVGQDVSENVKVFRRIPQSIPGLRGAETVAVRGELIMSRALFESKYKKSADKQSALNTQKFSNSRAMIVGTINRQNDGVSTTEALNDAHFIAHELIQNKHQSTNTYKPSQGLQILKSYGFTVVPNKVFSSVDDEVLRKILETRKQKSTFDVDGLVVVPDVPYRRTTSDRPDYAIAFKDNSLSEQKVVEVKDVQWNITRTNILAPRVVIEPTHLSGSTITYLTGFNGFFIENGFSYKDRHDPKIAKTRKPIGPGAKVRIVKSGDVIPYIMEVVVPARVPKLPEIPYVYDSNRVNLVLDTHNIEDEEQRASITVNKQAEQFLYFFRTIGALNIGDALARNMVENGSNKMVNILKMKPSDFEKSLNLSSHMANKIHNSIHEALKQASLATIAAATGLFGRGMGQGRLSDVFDEISDIMTVRIQTPTEKTNLQSRIASISGLSYASAEQIVSNLDKFRKFVSALGIAPESASTTRSVQHTISNKLRGTCVVFSKIRDKVLENKIIENGGKVASSVTKEVTHVIVSDLNDNSSKIRKARENGKEVIVLRDFVRKFGL